MLVICNFINLPHNTPNTLHTQKQNAATPWNGLQSSVCDARTSGHAPRTGNCWNPRLCGPVAQIGIHADTPGWMVSDWFILFLYGYYSPVRPRYHVWRTFYQPKRERQRHSHTTWQWGKKDRLTSHTSGWWGRSPANNLGHVLLLLLWLKASSGMTIQRFCLTWLWLQRQCGQSFRTRR